MADREDMVNAFLLGRGMVTGRAIRYFFESDNHFIRGDARLTSVSLFWPEATGGLAGDSNREQQLQCLRSMWFVSC